MILHNEDKTMEFDFSGFCSAEDYDTRQNQCAGLKIVDFAAENDDAQFFIEVKNYARKSDDPQKQARLSERQVADYKMLTDPDAAFPLEMGMKFKDSLLRWYASGKKLNKPVAFLLVVNAPSMLTPKNIIKLIQRVNGYIPAGLNKKADQYPMFTAVFFDMVTADEAQTRYGFSVSVHSYVK
jgi:hypothetical protein